ncbi:hypothetical protein ACR78H_21610 [Sphingobacterium siyangense]|uniref:hypothetical protein n=1 Tax=Sphingobacterium siyangense TaxID=459529 RepID=UPI003DA26316
MKSFFLMTVTGLFFISCKKDQPEIKPDNNTKEQLMLSDSISYTINGVKYTSNDRFATGFSNKQINIKPYSQELPNRHFAYSSGNTWWYGEKDSLLVEYNYEFLGEALVRIGFTKKYNIAKLQEGPTVYQPINGFQLTRGPQQFMTDYGRENKTSGVFLSISPKSEEAMFSYIPNRSMTRPAQLNNNIQDDAKFTILKFEKLDGGFYLLEAEFELNGYTEKNKKYRIKDGFLRLVSQFKRF